MIPRLYVPAVEPEDVVRHLARKEKHWKAGKSAHALAYVWHGRADFPPAIDRVLKAHSIFESAKLIDGFLERQTDLGSLGHHSQTDLLVIAGLDQGLAVLAIEGKAGEPFGEYVHEWLGRNEEEYKEKEYGKKKDRLEDLEKRLRLSRDETLSLRYQLLHRAASAILEAKRYRTSTAALLVHSFSDDKKGFADFCSFLKKFGVKDPFANTLVGPILRDGVSLYAAWVQDDPPNDATPLTYLDSMRSYAEKRIEECQKFCSWCDEQQSKR